MVENLDSAKVRPEDEVEIKMAGKARQKFKEIDAEGPAPVLPSQQKVRSFKYMNPLKNRKTTTHSTYGTIENRTNWRISGWEQVDERKRWQCARADQQTRRGRRFVPTGCFNWLCKIYVPVPYYGERNKISRFCTLDADDEGEEAFQVKTLREKFKKFEQVRMTLILKMYK